MKAAEQSMGRCHRRLHNGNLSPKKRSRLEQQLERHQAIFRMRELGVGPKERRILGGDFGNRGRVAGLGGDLRRGKGLIRKCHFPYQSYSARPRPTGVDRPGGLAPVPMANQTVHVLLLFLWKGCPRSPREGWDGAEVLEWGVMDGRFRSRPFFEWRPGGLKSGQGREGSNAHPAQ
jgi:hypothetical protein